MCKELLRLIPPIDRLLERESVRKSFKKYPRKLIVECMRETAASWRQKIKRGSVEEANLTEDVFIEEALSLARIRAEGSYTRVINATGIILNTNLGRAPLSQLALEKLNEISAGYSNLEFDLEKGERGRRDVHVEDGLCKLTGAKSALVVNNNAAAVLLVLDTFAKRKEVIVSRGELIEIGGSFRLPDVLKKSGAKLVEIGTTNRTYIADYEKAITEKTAIILKSHTSNYRVVGFVHKPEPQELVRLAKKHKIICMEDIGSGLFVDLSMYELDEPTVQQAVKAGMNLVTFSGDKLLGGPQCGIILGNTKLINELRLNPLTRALRVDKLTLSALTATLAIYLYSDTPMVDIPHLFMIMLDTPTIKRKAQRMESQLERIEGLETSIVQSSAAVGGGSCPGLKIPSWAVGIKSKKYSAQRLAKLLRKQNPPVIATVSEDRVNLDMRTILLADEKPLIAAFKSIMA